MSTSFPNVGKYQILEEVGRGGMGAVYKGHDPFLDRTVAIKLLAPHLVWEKAFLERFMREARAAARLDHPNVIHIYDVGQDGNNYYFVMAYLPGPSLKDFISQRGRLAPAVALPILRQLAAALDYAHNKGLIHRDVKPANVMFNEHGQVVLMDFGIVKAVEESRLTSKGTSIGTPQYMAPEQIQGPEVDAHTDQYALGIIAFEMLTGRVPFDADTTTVILYKQVNEPPPSATACCPDLPPAVEPALNRALAKSPAERYGSCGDFVSALEQALAQPAQIWQPETQRMRPESDRGVPYTQPTEPAREELRRKQGVPIWVWGLGGAVLLACMIGLGILIAGSMSGRATTTPVAVRATATPIIASANTPTVVPVNLQATATEQARQTEATRQSLMATATQMAVDQRLSATAAAQAQATAATQAQATAAAQAQATAAAQTQATAQAQAQATAAARVQVVVADVDARKGWQSTGLSVDKNAKLTLEVVGGQWTHWKGTAPYNTGQGGDYICGNVISPSQCVEPLPTVPAGALIGRAGSQVFSVGRRTTVVAQQSGPLSFRINDSDDGLYDNDGILNVRITIER